MSEIIETRDQENQTEIRRAPKTTEELSINDAAFMNDDYSLESIDLLELFGHVLDHWVTVLVCAVLVTALTAVYTLYFVTPMYRSTTKLYVLQSKDSAINLSDFQISNYLASDYQEVFKNWHVHERVLQETGLQYTYTQLERMVTVENPANTRILYITVRSANAKEAKLLADVYAKVACEFIAVKMDQEQPNIFEEARVANAPYSPRLAQNLMLGFVVGVILSSAFIIIKYQMDDMIRTPEDIEKALGLPTLGVVTEQDTFRHGHSTSKKSGASKKPAKSKR